MNKSLLFILIGVAFFSTSFSYNAGTITAMGPAFFPRVVSVILIILGLFMALKNDR
jgi:hypothetical protein